jgi:hypothetical protein
MATNKATSTNEPSLLVDLGTASRLLGLKCSSVRRLVLREDLPAIKAGKGGKLFIPRQAILRFVERLR